MFEPIKDTKGFIASNFFFVLIKPKIIPDYLTELKLKSTYSILRRGLLMFFFMHGAERAFELGDFA